MLTFDTNEYKTRVANLQALMDRAGMEALFVLGEANMNYLTGYDGRSDYVPQAALITLDSDTPRLILREMDIHCATSTCWLPEASIIGYEEALIAKRGASPWPRLAELARQSTGTARIGCEMTATGFGVLQHGEFVSALGVEALQNADGMVARLKKVKSPQEIAYQEEAAVIVDQAMREGIEAIAEGVRESEVAGIIMRRLCTGTEEIAGGPTKNPTMPVAPVANAPHLKWSDRRYSAGLQTNFEIGAFRHRYCCALSRTAFLGKPPDRLHDVHAAVLEGFEAAFALLRPGQTCGAVARAFSSAFEPHGIRKASRIGYSLGIDWTDGGASLQSDDETELVPGMVLHLIIGIWEREEGYVLSETVKITADGPVSMTTLPRMPFII
ncbi:M24 family metallopeptidase [Sulfitobacter porphyrae]|uniref:M24 family metallopeptidase n=1 Tax=Sulfitobacter porphyrae TaxID=1246864 RepID=A0ABW2BDL2_9RHOB